MICATLDSTLNSRLFRNPSTLYRPQPSLAYSPVPRPLLRFVGSRSTLDGSASVTHRVQGDCALSQWHQNTAPGPFGPQKIIGAMPCSIGWVTNLVVISQPLGDSRHRRIKIKNDHWLVINGRSSCQSNLVVKDQSADLLLHLNSYRIRHLPFGYWDIFSFNCFVTGNETSITDKLAAADANQVWWFKTNPYSGSLPQPN